MNDNTAQMLAKSLTSDTVDIIPFLPYLLQDLWELGSSPADMLHLIQKHMSPGADAKALDLGCGKGAVSIALARELKIRCKGIDLLPDFVWYAKEKAADCGVADLCAFEVGDIAEAVRSESGYDLLIYGAVGDVLGPRADYLPLLAATVRPGGWLFIDDGYLPDGSDGSLLFDNEYPTLPQWETLIRNAGLTLAAVSEAEGENPDHARDFANIAQRAAELAKAYPHKRELLAQYVQNQKNAYKDLGGNVVGATFVIRK